MSRGPRVTLYRTVSCAWFQAVQTGTVDRLHRVQMRTVQANNLVQRFRRVLCGETLAFIITWPLGWVWRVPLGDPLPRVSEIPYRVGEENPLRYVPMRHTSRQIVLEKRHNATDDGPDFGQLVLVESIRIDRSYEGS